MKTLNPDPGEYPAVVNTTLRPSESLELLSRAEVARLLDSNQGGLYELFRNCSLAVLNCGNETDDGKALLERFRSFDIQVNQTERGIKLHINAAPASAFVDGKIIKGIGELVFSVLRDTIYIGNEIDLDNLDSSEAITDAVFQILRNAGVLNRSIRPNMVVCWGGHSISREEYEYTKDVGYQLGLRGLDICTGCGPGAMKGPMKGATIGHSKQRIKDGVYLGLTEPGIIAAEAPNPIVNNLVIMPDIEKRLEAFVRAGHGFVVFPGGAGTTEEILYLLGILLHPDNAGMPFPLILTGPASSADYFNRLDEFVQATLGESARARYQVIIDDPVQVAVAIKQGIRKVKLFRLKTDDAFYFNWKLKIDDAFQHPFQPSHANMEALEIRENISVHQLAVNLRQVFSGIVAGNVKDQGIRSVERYGNYRINGDRKIMNKLDELLSSFVEQGRMKLPGSEYKPCYEVVRS